MLYFEFVKFNNSSNVCDESINFKLKNNVVNSLSSINKKVNNLIFKSIIGFNKENIGGVFLDNNNLFELKQREVFYVVNEAVSFIKNTLHVDSKLKTLVIDWQLLNDIDTNSKSYIENFEKYKIKSFWEKSWSEIDFNEYLLMILFIINISNKKIFIIHDFFEKIDNKKNAQIMVNEINKICAKLNITVLLISFDFMGINSLNEIKISKESQYTKNKNILTYKEKKQINIKNVFFKKNLVTFFFKKNLFINLSLMIINMLLFSSFILFYFISSKNDASNYFSIYSIIVSIISIIYINSFFTYVIFKKSKNHFEYPFLEIKNVFISILFIIIWEYLFFPFIGLIFSLIPILSTIAYINIIESNINVLISSFFIVLSPFVFISSLLIFLEIKNIFKKEEVDL